MARASLTSVGVFRPVLSFCTQDEAFALRALESLDFRVFMLEALEAHGVTLEEGSCRKGSRTYTGRS